MRLRKALLCALLCLVGVLPAVAGAGTMSPALADSLQRLDSQELVTVLVVMSDQPDIRGLDQKLHDAKAPLAERHETVVRTLRDAAARSQGALLADLAAVKSAGRIVSYKPHWIINAVLVRADAATVLELAQRSDVARIEPNLVVELIEPVESQATLSANKSGIGLAPGIAAIRAPQVWNELGIDGTGVIVGNLDSGVDGTHEALASRWRGLYAPPAECWLDAVNLGSPDFPVDVRDHGTHVMGTLTGYTPDNLIGVAPGALWIASNGVSVSVSEVFDNAVLVSLEFFADPDGDPATTADVPAVVQNSWGVNENFPGYYDCDSRWWDAIDNCEAAGVALVFSAGNEGPFPGTLRSPADRATSPTNCFSVGSTLHDAPYTISVLSSRGPSGCGGEFAMKPEVAAPGSEIYSALPGNVYGDLSGTSHAGPHVAGIVALMRAANPNLDVIAIKEVLMATARDLGDPGEDYDYGHGLVDAYAAVASVMPGIGYVQGTITDSATGGPVPGAALETVLTGVTVTADAFGAFRMPLYPGPHDLRVSGFGYAGDEFTVDVPAAGTVAVAWSLAPLPTAELAGTVYDENGQAIGGAEVSLLNAPLPALLTSSNGRYAWNLPFGPSVTYTVNVNAGPLGRAVQSTELPDDTVLDFHLVRGSIEDFESGNFLAWPWAVTGWEVVAESPFSGNYCARTTPIDHDASVYGTLTFECLAAGDLRFRYRLPSGDGRDFMILMVDDAWMRTLYVQTDWTLYSAPIPAGPHTLTWVFLKWGSASEVDVRASVDYIELPEAVIPALPALDLSKSSLVFNMIPNQMLSTTLTMSNTGEAVLDYTNTLVTDASKVLAPPLESAYKLILAQEDSPLPAEKLAELRALVGDGAESGEKAEEIVPAWLTVSPASGSIAPGANQVLTVVANSGGLEVGVYAASLVIRTNDPYHEQVIVPVTMNVSLLPVKPGKVPHATLVITPNPFNPATELQFALQGAEKVRLAIYDLSGRLIDTLVSAELPAGEHSVTWHGRDQTGRSVASGRYFARLTAGGETIVKSLMLVR